jgi:hypothetical protein
MCEIFKPVNIYIHVRNSFVGYFCMAFLTYYQERGYGHADENYLF